MCTVVIVLRRIEWSDMKPVTEQKSCAPCVSGTRDVNSVYGVGGDGWYEVSPAGLNLANPNVRFSVKFNTEFPPIGGLVAFGNVLKTRYRMWIESVNGNRRLFFSRTQPGTTEYESSEIFTANEASVIGDGQWHTIDISINAATKQYRISIDRVNKVVTDENHNGEPLENIGQVFLGGGFGKGTVNGFFRNVFFNNTQKTDLTYQYIVMKGIYGGDITVPDE